MSEERYNLAPPGVDPEALKQAIADLQIPDGGFKNRGHFMQWLMINARSLARIRCLMRHALAQAADADLDEIARKIMHFLRSLDLSAVVSDPMVSVSEGTVACLEVLGPDVSTRPGTIHGVLSALIRGYGNIVPTDASYTIPSAAVITPDEAILAHPAWGEALAAVWKQIEDLGEKGAIPYHIGFAHPLQHLRELNITFTQIAVWVMQGAQTPEEIFARLRAMAEPAGPIYVTQTCPKTGQARKINLNPNNLSPLEILARGANGAIGQVIRLGCPTHIDDQPIHGNVLEGEPVLHPDFLRRWLEVYFLNRAEAAPDFPLISGCPALMHGQATDHQEEFGELFSELWLAYVDGLKAVHEKIIKAVNAGEGEGPAPSQSR